MRYQYVPRLLLAGVTALALAACGGAETPPPPEAAASTDVPATAETAGATPTSTSAPITHLTFPDEFAYTSLQRIYDCHTGRRAQEGGAVAVNPACDAWPRSDVERPMDARGESYAPQVDILMAEFGEDEGWYYVRIYTSPVAGSPPPALSYALELDLNLDGAGEILLLASDPAPDAWSVAGVQVWRDANRDVAGEAVGQSPTSGDGYEGLAFDQGEGEDPDLAWSRLVMEDAAVVELALKKSLLEGRTPFAWWVWASAGPLDPGAFELVDRAQPETAFLIDNTCAWTFGRASVAPPNACPAIADVLPTAVPASGPSCVPPPEGCAVKYGDPCYLWYNCACICFN